jgi:hypothetical protein
MNSGVPCALEAYFLPSGPQKYYPLQQHLVYTDHFDLTASVRITRGPYKQAVTVLRSIPHPLPHSRCICAACVLIVCVLGLAPSSRESVSLVPAALLHRSHSLMCTSSPYNTWSWCGHASMCIAEVHALATCPALPCMFQHSRTGQNTAVFQHTQNAAMLLEKLQHDLACVYTHALQVARKHVWL